MNDEKYTPEQILKALEESEGFKAIAAEKLGCTFATVNNYQHRYPEIDMAIKQIREKYKDKAERRLRENIEDGKETSLIFFLKTQCRDRGYIEKKEVDLGGSIKLERVIDALSDDEREALISGIEEDLNEG